MNARSSPRRFSARGRSSLAIVLSLLVVQGASATPPTSATPASGPTTEAPSPTPNKAEANAAAQALFREGRAMLDRGDVHGACAKFEGSLKLEPAAMGTLFNLALCNERRGRYATAWSQYMDVLASSRDSRPDRAELAETQARALEARLSRLWIVVPPDVAFPGLVVALDGIELPTSSFDIPVPVDGGEHEIRASAEGYETATQRVTLAPERDSATVKIEPLVRLPDPPPPDARAPLPPAPRARMSERTLLGWSLAVVGAGTLAVGTGFGVAYLADVRDAQRHVDAYPELYGDTKSALSEQAGSKAWVANVTIPLGLVLAGVGAVLLLIPEGTSTTARR